MESNSFKQPEGATELESETTQFHSYFSFSCSVRATFQSVVSPYNYSSAGICLARKVAPADPEKLEKLGNYPVSKEKLPSFAVLSVSLARSDQKLWEKPS